MEHRHFPLSAFHTETIRALYSTRPCGMGRFHRQRSKSPKACGGPIGRLLVQEPGLESRVVKFRLQDRNATQGLERIGHTGHFTFLNHHLDAEPSRVMKRLDGRR